MVFEESSEDVLVRVCALGSVAVGKDLGIVGVGHEEAHWHWMRRHVDIRYATSYGNQQMTGL